MSKKIRYNISSEDAIKEYYEASKLDGKDCYKCTKCSVVKYKNNSGGFTNLLDHLDRCRNGWEKVLQDKLCGAACNYGLIFPPIVRNLNILTNLVVKHNLPISCVDWDEFKMIFEKEKLSRPTFSAYLIELGNIARTKIKNILPKHVGIIFDGWQHNNIHYIALVAVFNEEISHSTKFILLSMTEITGHDCSALSHQTHIEAKLLSYGIEMKNVLFLVADNCNTNKALSRIANIPMIGCASHRLNLACKLMLEEYSEELKLIHEFMVFVSTQANNKKLREITDLCPVERNTTRWSSSFEMIKRYLLLHDLIIKSTFHEATAKLLSPERYAKIISCKNMLDTLENLTERLQAENITMLTVRKYFDEVIDLHPVMNKYLKVDADIVCTKDFEAGIIALQKNSTNPILTEAQAKSVKCFEYPLVLLLPVGNNVHNINSNSNSINIFDEVDEEEKQRNSIDKPMYRNTSYIPPTSVYVERFFSKCKYLLTDHRSNLSENTMETIMLLKANDSLWNIQDVSIAESNRKSKNIT